MMRVKSAIPSTSILVLCFGAGTYFYGKDLSVHWRHALAGTCATVGVEFATHVIDTMNMQSKVMVKSSLVSPSGRFLWLQSQAALFKGVTAVVWGYTHSSMIYFYFYGRIKEWLNKRGKTSDEKTQNTLWQTMRYSLSASLVAEFLALWFYYPYDLIKTRMQTSNEIYGYRNLTDAFTKIW